MTEFTPIQQEALFKVALNMITQVKELALKESEARIAVIANKLSTSSSSLITMKKNDDTIGELFLEAWKVAAHYSDLPQKEIAAIYKRKFISENLYKLQMLYEQNDKDQTTQFTIELDSDLQFKRIKGTLKDFSNTTAIWFTEFLNYCSIMIDLFSITFSTLHQKLLIYHQQIIELSSVYE